MLEVNLSPACAERTDWMKGMLDAMAAGMFGIILDGDEPGEPIQTPSYDWRCIYAEAVCPEAKYCNPHVALEVVGEKINLRWERKLERKYITSMAAIVIQKVLRGFLVRNRKRSEIRNTSALKIQCKVRQFLSKIRAKTLVAERSARVIKAVWGMFSSILLVAELRVTQAVVTIQAHFRRCQAKTQLKRLKVHRAARTIWNSLKVIEARHQVSQLRLYLAGVRCIQGCIRRKLQAKNSAAQVIQKAWLLHQNRRAFKASLNKFKASDALITSLKRLFARRLISALRINFRTSLLVSVAKGFLAAKQVQLLKRCKAASTIQRKTRAYLARCHKERLKKDKDAVVKAAIFVQKVCRGFLERVEFHSRLQEASALAIQKAFRGSLSRQHLAILKLRHNAAIKLQRFMRMKQKEKKHVADRQRMQTELNQLRLAAKLRTEAQRKVTEVTLRLSNSVTKKIRAKPEQTAVPSKLKRQITPLKKLDHLAYKKLEATSQATRLEDRPPPSSKGPQLTTEALLDEIFAKKPRKRPNLRGEGEKKRNRIARDLIFDQT